MDKTTEFCSLIGRFTSKHWNSPTCFSIREQDLSFSLSNYPCDWTDVCSFLYFSSASLSFFSSDADIREQTLIWPITLTFQSADHPKPANRECSIPPVPALRTGIQHAPPTPLIGQFSFKWACFASTHFFPHIFQGCGFYWSLSSQEWWCLDWGTQQQLVGLLMVVSPAGCAVLGFEWCQAQQLPCSPTALSEDAH